MNNKSHFLSSENIQHPSLFTASGVLLSCFDDHIGCHGYPATGQLYLADCYSAPSAGHRIHHSIVSSLANLAANVQEVSFIQIPSEIHLSRSQAELKN